MAGHYDDACNTGSPVKIGTAHSMLRRMEGIPFHYASLAIGGGAGWTKRHLSFYDLESIFIAIS